MDALFTLYRYLATNKHSTDENNSYNVALRTLEPVLDLLRELDTWGNHIAKTGGIEWEDADKITHRIMTAHEIALIQQTGSSLTAITDFAAEYLNSDEILDLIHILSRLIEIGRKKHDDD